MQRINTLSLLLLFFSLLATPSSAQQQGAELAPAQEWEVKKDWLKQLTLREDGQQAAIADSIRNVYLVELATGKVEKKFSIERETGEVTDLAYLPGKQGLIAGFSSGTGDGKNAVVHVDLEGKVIRQFDVATEHRGRAHFALYPTKQLLAVVWGDEAYLSQTSRISLWNYETGELLKSVEGWPQPYSILFAPDGRSLLIGASGSGDGVHENARISMLSTKDLSTMKEQPFENGTPLNVALSPDAKKLAVSYEEPKARHLEVWRTDRMTAVHQLINNETEYTSDLALMKFTPDSAQLFTCEQLKDDAPFRLRLWNVAKGNLVATLTGHTGETYCSDIALSTDGKYLFTIDSVGLLRRWDVGSLAKK